MNKEKYNMDNFENSNNESNGRTKGLKDFYILWSTQSLS